MSEEHFLLEMLGCVEGALFLPFKADKPNVNIAIIWTSIFEWYVVRCGSKNVMTLVGVHVMSCHDYQDMSCHCHVMSTKT
jgi:hypothetical protein